MAEVVRMENEAIRFMLMNAGSIVVGIIIFCLVVAMARAVIDVKQIIDRGQRPDTNSKKTNKSGKYRR